MTRRTPSTTGSQAAGFSLRQCPKVTTRAIRAARGFSITELMVALTLSSFVILGIVSLFVSNSQTMRVQDALSAVSDSGRFAISRIARDLRMIGFRATGYDNPIALANALNATAATSDTLTLRFEAAADCNRDPADASGVVTNTYTVEGDNLTCNGEILARGVEEMRVWLGEDTNSNRVPDRFVLANAAGLIMDRVVSVRVDLLVRSLERNVTNTPPALTGLWKRQIDNDTRLRHEFSVNVALRNRR